MSMLLAMAWAMMMRSKGSRWMSGSSRMRKVVCSSMGRDSMRCRCLLIVMYLSGVSDRMMCPFPYLMTISQADAALKKTWLLGWAIALRAVALSLGSSSTNQMKATVSSKSFKWGS